MSEDIQNLLLELLHQQGMQIDKLDKNFAERIGKLEKKVDELVELKNKLIAGGVVLSALFGFLWDCFKNIFKGN